MNLLVIFGTRPEAIKLAPVITLLRESTSISLGVCVTAQHRQMLDQVLRLFEITPDFDLNMMRPDQTLADITSSVLQELQPVFQSFRPDMIVVHGDTSTTFGASLAAYYNRIAVAHVEAGLRTGNLYSPFPEEANRRLTAALTSLHFAPTETARENLLCEGVTEESIVVTGNTVIDALLSVTGRLDDSSPLDKSISASFPQLRSNAKMVLITGHRRENFGTGFERICKAILASALNFPEVDFVYPVHLNPNVRTPVKRLLSQTANIHLIDPQDYLPFVWLMRRSHLILTDSGGIQEEAPSLGKPVLVMRDTTERPEAIAAGTARLVGTDVDHISHNVHSLLTDSRMYNVMAAATNPYGDGTASIKIVKKLSEYGDQARGSKAI